jgi:pilus assembly protein CpaE
LEASLSRLRAKEGKDRLDGRLLGVLSASGGCGASTIAVNIAASLAQSAGQCCLLDLNLGRGDLAALLDLRPQYTLADACGKESRLDQGMLLKMLTRHSCGIALLASPPDYRDTRAGLSRAIAQTLALAKKSFPEVIVDLEDCFHEEQFSVLRQANGILLVCRLTFTSVRNARRTLEYLTKAGVDRSRVRVVVNCQGVANELPVEEAESALGEKLTNFIPYDAKTINAADNTGIPSVLRDPAAKVSQYMAQLARLDFGKPSKSSSVLAKIGLR